MSETSPQSTIDRLDHDAYPADFSAEDVARIRPTEVGLKAQGFELDEQDYYKMLDGELNRTTQVYAETKERPQPPQVVSPVKALRRAIGR